MVWREPRDHVTDCYFYAVSTTGFNAQNKASIAYSDLPSARRPTLHCNEMSFPTQEISVNWSNYSVASTPNEMSDNEKLDESYKEEVISQQFSQIDLNALVRDLNLSEELWELLASRIAEKNLSQ